MEIYESAKNSLDSKCRFLKDHVPPTALCMREGIAFKLVLSFRCSVKKGLQNPLILIAGNTRNDRNTVKFSKMIKIVKTGFIIDSSSKI